VPRGCRWGGACAYMRVSACMCVCKSADSSPYVRLRGCIRDLASGMGEMVMCVLEAERRVRRGKGGMDG
jgi:hypothetical protein